MVSCIYNIGAHTLYYKVWDTWGSIAVTQKGITVKGGGVSECPNLFVWNGEEFVDEGMLPIHNEENPLHPVSYIKQNSRNLRKISCNIEKVNSNSILISILNLSMNFTKINIELGSKIDYD